MTADHASTPDTTARNETGTGVSARRSPGDLAPAAAVGFGFLILRIFAVSGYDWDTAFAVSTTLNLSDGLALVFGSLMAGHVLVEILLVGVLPLLIATYLWSNGGHRALILLAATLSLVTLLALTVSFHVWWLPVAAGAVFAALAVIRKLPLKHWLRRISTAAMAGVGWVTGTAFLLVAAFVQTPWVPHELIETMDGTLSGYVLSVDSGYLNVLTDNQEFLIVLSSDVLSRK